MSEEQTKQRGRRHILVGTVTSNKMDKTATVLVTRYQIVDKRYGKRVMRTKKYHMHDEKNECDIGDMVMMKPLEQRMSKTKSTTLDTILRKVVVL